MNQPKEHFKPPNTLGFLSLLSMFVLVDVCRVGTNSQGNEGPLFIKVISRLSNAWKELVHPSRKKWRKRGLNYSADDKIVEEILSSDEENTPFDFIFFRSRGI